jgi:predicted regulator of Ras-like GTPase activity (Roadblock/LC7/MglB family)
MAKREKKKSLQEALEIPETTVLDENPSVTGLRASLDEIKTFEGVKGYIMRNTTSAAIDLNDPSKIVDYAILSSSAFDAAQELAPIFELGDAKEMLVEGKNVKMLSMIVDGNKISVFMEKNTDCEKILRKLHVT